MKASNNKNILLFVFFFSAALSLLTFNIVLILVTASIGFILISSFSFTQIFNGTPVPSSQSALDRSEAEISFFDDYDLEGFNFDDLKSNNNEE